MPANQFVSRIHRTGAAIALVFSVAQSTAHADARLSVGPLPEPLIKTEQCVNVGNDGWGWDGEQSCRITRHRLAGEPYPLTQSRRDYGGSDLVWSSEDLAGKTVRCDTYKLSFLPSAADNEYIRARYDITFLNDDSIPASASLENLNDVTAHLYTRGWSIGRFGYLDSGLQTGFNGDGYATETGYLFVEESREQYETGDFIVSNFSHCYLRDETAPLRATGYCVDYDGDGIGWNGSAECEVSSVNPDCDYSSSNFNFGWGFNTVTGESCPPIDNTESFTAENRCVGSGSDGWGWNQALQQSCRLPGF